MEKMTMETKNLEMTTSIREMRKRLRTREYNKCLLEDGCECTPIIAHSVPRGLMDKMDKNGHVIAVTAKGRDSQQPVIAREEIGINKATTGKFICREHDEIFKPIDKPFDCTDKYTLNLVFLRAILKEIWLLENLNRNLEAQKDIIEAMHSPSTSPWERLRSLKETKMKVLKCLNPQDCKCKPTCVVQHQTKVIKTPIPIVAGSIASGGYTYIQLNNVTIEDINSAWGFSIFPMEDQHTVVMSAIDNPQIQQYSKYISKEQIEKSRSAKRYFEHIVKSNGRGLEESVSAELLLFSENWIINPTIWDAYGRKKQEAIITAFNNLEEIYAGKYRWMNKGKWWEEVGIPNRHQLNLFIYNQELTKPPLPPNRPHP